MGQGRRKSLAVAGAVLIWMTTSAHVGSPDVFFSGKAGPYDVRVVIRPPEVVPGIARVTVHAPEQARSVSIRPVFWRAGSRGAPSADETRQLAGAARTFEGALWLMARGAYSVDVIVDGSLGKASVLVPVASVATGQLPMGVGLGALLVALAALLVASLVTIVYKGAGESLVEPGHRIDGERGRRARRVAAIAVPLIALGLLGGARWWRAVDRDYDRTIYRPSPLHLTLDGDRLILQATDTVFTPPRRPSPLMPDHGKLMHLFLVRAGDAGAFAHLHPAALDSSANPRFSVQLPALPAGTYHAYGDVVHETGFERTLVGSLTIRQPPPAVSPASADPDDAWFVGMASRERSVRLGDGSTMSLEIVPNGVIEAGREVTLRLFVMDPAGRPAALEPYLGMAAHAVVMRIDGDVYVHLHPMGTVTSAAQIAFQARDRGDTTDAGRLVLAEHASHPGANVPEAVATTEFPYAFPRAGSYRLFVQVKRDGRILTGAFAISVAAGATPESR